MSDVGLSEGLDFNAAANEERQSTEDQFVETRAAQPEPVAETKMEMPEGLDPDLWDSVSGDFKKMEMFERLQTSEKRIADLRKIISKGKPTPPEDIDGYTIDLDEELKGKMGDDLSGLDFAKRAALSAGMDADTFNNFANNYFKNLNDEGFFDQKQEEVKSEEQLRQEEESFIKAEKEKLGEAGERLLSEMHTTVSDLVRKGSLTDADVEAFKNAAYNADGVMFLQKWANLYNAKNIIPSQNAVVEGMLTREELFSMKGDPRYKTDPQYRARVEEGYQKLDQLGRLT